LNQKRWKIDQKDSYSSLVSNENLSEMLSSNAWALGQVK